MLYVLELIYAYITAIITIKKFKYMQKFIGRIKARMLFYFKI